MAETIVAEPVATTPRKGWKMPEYSQNSRLYFFTAREGAGLVFAFLLVAWPLMNWEPQGAVGVYITWFIGALILVWYNAAQRNALVITADEKRMIDDKQIQRDTGWSSLPNYVIYLQIILTIVGLVLSWITPVFDNPDSHWIRDRMIISWPYAGYLALVFLVLRGDQTQNIELAAVIQRLMQRYRRDETH